MLIFLWKSENISNLVLFKLSKKEFQIVFDELLETKRDLALEIMRITYMNDDHNSNINTNLQSWSEWNCRKNLKNNSLLKAFPWVKNT